MFTYMRAFMCACIHACVRLFVRTCMCVCVWRRETGWGMEGSREERRLHVPFNAACGLATAVDRPVCRSMSWCGRSTLDRTSSAAGPCSALAVTVTTIMPAVSVPQATPAILWQKCIEGGPRLRQCLRRQVKPPLPLRERGALS